MAARQAVSTPAPKIKMVELLIAATEDQGAKRQNRRDPDSDEQSLVVAPVEPEINRQQERHSRCSDIGAFEEFDF